MFLQELFLSTTIFISSLMGGLLSRISVHNNTDYKHTQLTLEKPPEKLIFA